MVLAAMVRPIILALHLSMEVLVELEEVLDEMVDSVEAALLDLPVLGVEDTLAGEVQRMVTKAPILMVVEVEGPTMPVPINRTQQVAMLVMGMSPLNYCSVERIYGTTPWAD